MVQPLEVVVVPLLPLEDLAVAPQATRAGVRQVKEEVRQTSWQVARRDDQILYPDR